MLDVFLPRVAMALCTVVWYAVNQARGALDPGFTPEGLARYTTLPRHNRLPISRRKT